MYNKNYAVVSRSRTKIYHILKRKTKNELETSLMRVVIWVQDPTITIMLRERSIYSFIQCLPYYKCKILQNIHKQPIVLHSTQLAANRNNQDEPDSDY